MKDNLYTLLYSTILGVLCAAMLTAASSFCKPYQEANSQAEELKNVLTVLGVPFDETATASELIKISEEMVTKDTGDDLTLYKYSQDGKLVSIAMPFAGPGLWGPVEGFLAFEPDMTTIRAVSFYKQEETPGLGGEIGSESFQAQFAGKKIDGLAFVKDKAAQAENELDAISGATITCDKVQSILDTAGAKIITYRDGSEE